MNLIAHWDEAEPVRRDVGHLRGRWTNLVEWSDRIGVGLKRIEVDPGGWSTPAHVHGACEEIFYVLAGSGLSWQEGETYEVGPGDCLVHRRETEAHTLHAGPGGLDVLAFGQRAWDEAAYLPRAGMFWLGARWVRAGEDEDMPWKREVAAGAPELPERPSPRPASIVNAADAETAFGGVARLLGESAGSVLTGLNLVALPPGAAGAPPHCHTEEEEIFAVLDGSATLELTSGPALADRGEEPERRELRAGHVVTRPAGTGVAHALRAGGDGVTYLAYGTRRASDIAYYPDSNEVSFRGLKLVARLDHVRSRGR